MSERILLSPEIIELSQSNNIFMTLKMIILTTNTNLNGTRFTEDFIDGICENQKDFQGIALVVNRAKLEGEQYDKLTHEFNGKTLGTDMIGSFVSFEKVENDDSSKSLVGEARVMKRFPKTCNAISELYEQGELRFSCEVLVRKYIQTDEDTKEVNYEHGLNSLIANCIVSTPAEVEAKPTLLVASLNEDLIDQVTNETEILSGGVDMALSLGEKRKLMNQYVSKLSKKMMAKMMADQVLESAELSDIGMDMVDSMCTLMGEDFNANSYVGFWVGEETVFDTYFVAQNYYNGQLFMFDYSLDEKDVFTASNPRKAKFEFVEVAEQVLASISKHTAEIHAELESKNVEISSLQDSKGEIEKQLEETKAELSNIQTSKTEIENELANAQNELATVKDQVVKKDEALQLSQSEANEKIISLGEVVEVLKTQLKAVEPVVEEYNKVQAELAEKAKKEKQQALVKYALNSKMITEVELSENEEIKVAISEINESKIKEIVADRIVKSNIELSNLESGKDNDTSDDVVIVVSDTRDLIEPSIAEKYGL